MTPTYRTSGNAKHYATPSYRHQSTLGGRFKKAGWSDWTIRIYCSAVPVIAFAFAKWWGA